jgi:hypothetical protein
VANKITVELEPKDAEMVAAWQRQRDNIAAFGEQIQNAGEHTKKAHHEADSWLGRMKEGLSENTSKLINFFTGFAVVEKAADLVGEAIHKWIEELDEVLHKQREHEKLLAQELALAGKLSLAPQIEHGLEEIKGAKKSEKNALYAGVSSAAPDLSAEQQLALVKELAPLGSLLDESHLTSTAGIAGTLQAAAPGRKAGDIANLAYRASQMAGKRAGELGDPSTTRALELLQKKGGMSLEGGLAFETEAFSHGLSAKDVEKIGDSLSEQKDIGQLRRLTRTAEDAAKLKFYQTKDPKARLALLDDHKTAHAVLGERESERLALMDKASIAHREAELKKSESLAGGQIFRDTLAHDVQNPAEAQQRATELHAERRKEAAAKGLAAYDADLKTAEEADKDQFGGVIGGLLAGSRHYTGNLARELPGGRGFANRLAGHTDLEEKEHTPVTDENRAQPRSTMVSALARLVGLTQETNEHLKTIAGKDHAPKVDVKVEGGGGGGRGKVDYSHRAEPSSAKSLSASH